MRRCVARRWTPSGVCRGHALVPAYRYEGSRQPTDGTGGSSENVPPVEEAWDEPRSPMGPSQPIRTLYPQVKLRARTQERPWQTTVVTASPEEEDQAPAPSTTSIHLEQAHQVGERSDAVAAAEAAGDASLSTSPHTARTDGESANDVQRFLEEVRHQVEVSRYERNQHIPYPSHPDDSAPLFRRLKRHTKLEVVTEDPDFPTFQRLDAAVPLPPAGSHPWVKATPIGPYIVHGDGQINVHGGTGEVGFSDDPDRLDAVRPLPRHFRGLQHRSVIGRALPQTNGKVVQDAVVRHSFGLTGRGVFATRDIKKGETIMVVQSTAQNTGVKGEWHRLEEMIVDILRAAYGDGVAEEGNAASDEAVREARVFLHDWILSGQPSSLLEHWPAAATERVVQAIGGQEVLYALELHRNHIARLAAILDLNSFLVESFYAERKGMAYFPEAGFFNHSCVPNATYDIIPAHAFKDSDYYLDEAMARDEDAAEALEHTDDGDDVAVPHEKAHGGGGAEGEDRDGQGEDMATAVAASPTRNVAHLGEGGVRTYADLTEADAPSYLFCCRASEDVKAGEEIVISYVPPSWTFDNRQYVLHDRYHFWCKCPKCAPTLDAKYARGPKMMIGVIVFCIFLQVLLLYQRDLKNAVDEDVEAIRALPEEERLEALRARGIDVNHFADEEYEKRRRARRAGFFEQLENEKTQADNRFDDIRTRNPMIERELKAQGVKW